MTRVTNGDVAKTLGSMRVSKAAVVGEAVQRLGAEKRPNTADKLRWRRSVVENLD